MPGERSIWPNGADRWRTPAIVAASVGLHVVVLGYLALQSMDDFRRYGETVVSTDRPVIFLDIQPRPLLRTETPRPARPIPRIIETSQSPTYRPETPAPRSASAPPSPPAPRSPRAGNDPSLPANFGEPFWNAPPGGLGDRIARNLRGNVGCASPGLLNDRERAACDQRFGERAAAAPPIEGTGNAARDSRFAREGARALARYEARRRPLSARPGNRQPDDCGGSNLGFACAGAHLDPGFRQNREDDLDIGLGRGRADPTAPRLPHASERRD